LVLSSVVVSLVWISSWYIFVISTISSDFVVYLLVLGILSQ
jgi:hypothetical protein